jgi:polyisoprenoid-binding protein YceI
MANRNGLAALGVVAAMLVAPAARAADFDVDSSHSQVQFAVKHLAVSTVKGEFGKVTGKVVWDAKKPADTVIDVTIDTSTVNTREAARDGHLKGPDFFDVEKFPTATFKSKKVEAAGKDKLKVHGELTLRGVTRPVVLEVTGPSPETKSPFGTTVIAASATGKVNRKEFGMVWNKALDSGGLLVGEEVNLSIDVELVKKQEPAK